MFSRSSLFKILCFFLVFFIGATVLVHGWMSYLVKVPSGLGVIVCIYGLLDFRKLSALEEEELLNKGRDKELGRLKETEAYYKRLGTVRLFTFMFIAVPIVVLLYCFRSDISSILACFINLFYS